MTALSPTGTGTGHAATIAMEAGIALGIALRTGIATTTVTGGIAMTTEGAGTTTGEVSGSSALIIRAEFQKSREVFLNENMPPGPALLRPEPLKDSGFDDHVVM